MFLLLLFLGVQVLVGLYASTVVSSAAFDAARLMASPGAASSPVALAHAEEVAKRDLGRTGATADFDWTVRDDAIVLTLTAARPTLLPTTISGITDKTISRTVRVRVEAVR
jgi:hypothetical protein